MRQILILFGLLTFLEVSAQDSLTQFLAKNRYYIKSKDGQYVGDGWKKIIENVKTSKYFLLGEDHGTSEIPSFAKAIASSAKFEKIVVEVDPYTALEMQRAAKLEALEFNKWWSANGSTLSFYNAREEFDLLKQMVSADAKVWGLDQVSLVSDRLLLKILQNKATSSKARTAASEMLNKATKGFETLCQTGNGEAVFMFSSDSSTFANFRLAFDNESAECKSMIDAMALSSKIYKGWQKGSHGLRIKLMKHTLKNYLDQDSKGKMFFKFGADHMLKGESYVDIFDIGNMVENLADSEYENAFSLMIVGVSGNANSFMPIKGAETRPVDVQSADSDIHFLTPLLKVVDTESYTYFDLKPLKKALWKNQLKIEDLGLRRTILGYDAIVIIPTVSPSK